jgi:hypothetical protein
MFAQTLTQIAASSIVAPEGLTARELRVEATGFLMLASRTDSLDVRKYMIAKARAYRVAADAVKPSA